jgi:ABC-type glycerol-3-phosphate transport system substrate-binding protein
VREALGRDDVWGIGLSMSAGDSDTSNQFDQFTSAYDADYVTRDGRLVIDDPAVRRRYIKAIGNYTAIYRKGCTPPDSVTWEPSSNNKAFLAQKVVMTPNNTLSIVNPLKHERPEDYFENTATVEWPLGPGRQGFPDQGRCLRCRSLPGRRSRRHRQGIRPLSRGRGSGLTSSTVALRS